MPFKLMIASAISFVPLFPCFLIAQEHRSQPGLRMENHERITVLIHAIPWVFADDLWDVIEQEFEQHGLEAVSAYGGSGSGEGELVVRAHGGPRYQGSDIEIYESSVRLEYRRPVHFFVADERIRVRATTWWSGGSSTMTTSDHVVLGEPDSQREREAVPPAESTTSIEDDMREDLCRMMRGQIRGFIQDLFRANGGDPSSVDWLPRDPEGMPECV